MIAASSCGTLLICDAGFNLASATDRASAVAMAGIELPLAALSFWIAVTRLD